MLRCCHIYSSGYFGTTCISIIFLSCQNLPIYWQKSCIFPLWPQHLGFDCSECIFPLKYIWSSYFKRDFKIRMGLDTQTLRFSFPSSSLILFNISPFFVCLFKNINYLVYWVIKSVKSLFHIRTYYGSQRLLDFSPIGNLTMHKIDICWSQRKILILLLVSIMPDLSQNKYGSPTLLTLWIRKMYRVLQISIE